MGVSNSMSSTIVPPNEPVTLDPVAARDATAPRARTRS